MDETDMVMTKSGNSGVAAMAMIAVETPSSKCRFVQRRAPDTPMTKALQHPSPEGL